MTQQELATWVATAIYKANNEGLNERKIEELAKRIVRKVKKEIKP